jgi:hypothetical protein
MKLKHDKHHRELELMVGDWDLLCLNHCTVISGRNASLSKLAPKLFRPYKVIQCIGLVAYRMQLRTRAHIHNVFHVAFLRKFEGVIPAEILSSLPIIRVVVCDNDLK